MNITYYGTTDRSKDSTYNFYDGDETLSLFEANRRKARQHTFMPRLHYELNAPKVYLEDELTGSLTFQEQHTSNELASKQGAAAGSIPDGEEWGEASSAACLLNERTVRHPGYVQNKLRMTVNAGHHSYSVNSLLRYFRRSETLCVSQSDDGAHGVTTALDAPSVLASSAIYALSQRLSLERLMTRNSVGTRFYIGRNSLELQYAFELRSDNVAVDGGKGCHTMYMKHSLRPEYVLRYRRGHVTFDMPVSLFTSRMTWSGAGGGTKAYLSPSASWRHEFSPFWRMNVSGGFGQDEDADVMTPAEYYSTYRTRVLTADRIGWTRSARASVSFSYANVVTMFVWNFMAMASWSTRDHYNEYTYGGQFTEVRPVWSDVHTRMLFVMMSADKTFTRAGLSLKSTLNYNRTTLPVAQNGVKTAITGNVLAAAMTLRWDKLRWLAVSLRPTLNVTWQDPSSWSTGHNTLKSFYNVADVHLFPFKSFDVSLQWEYNALEVERGRFRRNSFLDAAVRYAATKRLEFRLQTSNLLNRDTYCEAAFTGLNYSYFSLPLRGREVLFSVAFNI